MKEPSNNSAEMNRVPYWASQRSKIFIVLIMFVIGLLLAWILIGGAASCSSCFILIPLFPIGLIYWFPAHGLDLDLNAALAMGYLGYIGLIVMILSNKNKHVVRFLLLLLVLLILANAAGCQYQVEEFSRNWPPL